MAASRYITTLIFLLSLSAGSLAQLAPEEIPADPDAEVVDEVRYYSVEVIVFEYSDLASAGNEIFDPEPAGEALADASGISQLKSILDRFLALCATVWKWSER